MLTCLIIDDNPMARLALKSLIEDLDYLQLKGECTNGKETLNFLHKEPIDLLFLDIEMPDMSGLEILSSLSVKPMAILITSKPEHAIEAFDLDVVDYIMKPVRLPRLIKAVERAVHRKHTDSNAQNDYFFIKSEHELIRIDGDKIKYIEAMGDYIRIISDEKPQTVHKTMKAVMAHLPAEKFIRIHRSYIVALNKVESFSDNMVVIQDKVLPVSEGYKASLLEKLNLL